MSGTRIDVRLTELGLAPSREKARSLIMAGVVMADGRRVDKPGDIVKEEQVIEVKEDPNPFVSRGGLKLQKAMKEFDLSLSGQVCMDIGASTGGFTDCMLQHGAKHVYAIDVGYGQLDWKLRNDERVTVMERTNARNMEPAWFPETATFASIDVSFISLKLILPPLHNCLADGGEVVALVKPQFEAGRSKVGKNGVVREASTHREVLATCAKTSLEIGFDVLNASFSPITGPKGNIEFLLHLRRSSKVGEAAFDIEDTVSEIVMSAHNSLVNN